MGGRCFVYIQSWHRCILKKKKIPPPPSRAPPPSFLPSLPPCVINITGFSEKAKEMFWMSWQIFKECIGVGEGRGGVRLGFVFFFFCLLLLVCFWGVLAKGEVTDQCCKVYRLHVIVTAVTAIVLFLLFLFSSKTMVGWDGDAQNFILIYDFYTCTLYFCFCNKKVEFLCN